MDIFRILDPDPHNNRCGSATLLLMKFFLLLEGTEGLLLKKYFLLLEGTERLLLMKYRISYFWKEQCGYW